VPGRLQRTIVGPVEPLARLALARASGALAGSARTAASAGALTALPLGGLGVGSLAYVGSYGAYFALQPASPLKPDEVLASSDARFVWMRVLSAVASLWASATNIYWDPQAGDNEASGLAAGAPVRDFAEIVRRYGTTHPILDYGVSLTIHLLSPQPAGRDPIVFEPYLPGGGNLVLIGTLAALGSAFPAGAITPKLRAAAGNALAVGGFPAGAATPMLVKNATRGSSTQIDSVAGAVATLCQPFFDAGLTTVQYPIQAGTTVLQEDDGWTAGDSLQLYVKPTANLKIFQARGADSPNAVNKPVTWVQNVHVPDPSGVVGFSVVGIGGEANHITSLCSFEPFVNSNIYDSGFGIDGASTSAFFGCVFLGGGQFRFKHIVGGSTGSAGKNFTNFNDGSVFDGDIILHGSVNVKGRYSNCGFALVLAGLVVDHGGHLLIRSEWVPGAMLYGNVLGVTASFVGKSATWGACLRMSQIVMDGLTTGSSRSGSTWTDGILLTSANLDLFDGLQNTSTGSRFS
jgi:hypothetical protein